MLIGTQNNAYNLGVYVGKKVSNIMNKEIAKIEDRIFGRLEEVEVKAEEVEIDF